MRKEVEVGMCKAHTGGNQEARETNNRVNGKDQQ